MSEGYLQFGMLEWPNHQKHERTEEYVNNVLLATEKGL